MDVKALWGKVQENKVLLGVLGALAVGGLAWVSRKPAGGAGAGEGGGESYPPAYNVSAMPTNAGGGYTAGPAYYDSSASDVYNALQPALENIGKQYEEFLKDRETVTAPPIPVPEPAAPRSSLGLFQVVGQNALYEVFTDNTRRHIGLAEAKEKGWWRNDAAVNWTKAGAKDAGWTKYRIVPE